MSNVFLEGDAVTLHSVDSNDGEDVDLVGDLLNSPAVWKSDAGVPERPLNRTTVAKWMEKFTGNDAILTRMRADSEDVGIAIIKDIDHRIGTADVGASLFADAQGQGYGTEAVRLQTEFCFEQLGLRKVTYETVGSNDLAVGLVDNVGGELEGVHRGEAYVDGEYRDVHHYGVFASEWDG